MNRYMVHILIDGSIAESQNAKGGWVRFADFALLQATVANLQNELTEERAKLKALREKYEPVAAAGEP